MNHGGISSGEIIKIDDKRLLIYTYGHRTEPGTSIKTHDKTRRYFRHVCPCY